MRHNIGWPVQPLNARSIIALLDRWIAEPAPSDRRASRTKMTTAAAMDMSKCVCQVPDATRVLHEKIVAARISPDDELRLLRMLQGKDVTIRDVEHRLYISRKMALEAAINSLGLPYLEAKVFKSKMLYDGATKELWDEVDQSVAAKERADFANARRAMRDR